METAETKIYIKDLTEHTGRFVSFFLVQDCSAKESKKGSGYLALNLRDRTGEIEGRLWDWDGIYKPEPDTFVKVDAIPNLYKQEIQLKVNQIREAADTEVVIEDFLLASKQNRDELLSDVYERIGGILDPFISLTVWGIITKLPEGSLRDCPAAKANHQPYLGGLMEHVLNLCSLADGLCVTYPGLDKDLLIAAAIIHDIGKVYELSFARSINYSRRGRLVGHVAMSLQMFWEVRPRDLGSDSEKLDHLEHIIASHHGVKDWGACEVPLSREAIVFHLLDMLDSRMGGFDLWETKPVDALGFTDYIPRLGGGAFLGTKKG